MWAGCTIEDGVVMNNNLICEAVQVGKDAKICKGAMIDKNVKVKSGVTIDASVIASCMTITTSAKGVVSFT
jgi:hypothetical protein